MEHDIRDDKRTVEKEVSERDQEVRQLFFILERQHISDNALDLVGRLILSKIFLEDLTVRERARFFIGKVDSFLLVSNLNVFLDKFAGEVAESKHIFFIFFLESVDEGFKSD